MEGNGVTSVARVEGLQDEGTHEAPFLTLYITEIHISQHGNQALIPPLFPPDNQDRFVCLPGTSYLQLMI